MWRPPLPDAMIERGLSIVTAAAASRLLTIILAVDATLIFIHIYVVSWTYHWDTTWAKIDQEDSISEAWENLKLILSGMALLLSASVTRRMAMLPLALCLLYLAVDNHFAIHERIGERMVERSLLGEIVFSAALALTLAAIAALSAYLSSQRERGAVLAIVACLILFGGFAVGADAVHYIFHESPRLNQPLTLLEDGGELLAISALAAICVVIVRQDLARRPARAQARVTIMREEEVAP